MVAERRRSVRRSNRRDAASALSWLRVIQVLSFNPTDRPVKSPVDRLFGPASLTLMLKGTGFPDQPRIASSLLS